MLGEASPIEAIYTHRRESVRFSALHCKILLRWLLRILFCRTGDDASETSYDFQLRLIQISALVDRVNSQINSCL